MQFPELIDICIIIIIILTTYDVEYIIRFGYFKRYLENCFDFCFEFRNNLAHILLMIKGDTFVIDKGFYVYYHYKDELVKYSILIFPRKIFKLGRVVNGVILKLD